MKMTTEIHQSPIASQNSSINMENNSIKEVFDVNSSAKSGIKSKEVHILLEEQLTVVNEKTIGHECFICHEIFSSYDNFKIHTSSLHGVKLIISKDSIIPNQSENRNTDL